MKTISDYTIYCTPSQTKKALELGAPIFPTSFNDNGRHQIFDKENLCYYDIPTAEQMIGFLRSKGIKFYFNDLTALWQVVHDTNIIGQGCSNNKELKVIDVALEYLENIKL